MNKKLKEADKKFKKGEDNLTTGIFQWSKDYASAASNFSEAGTQSIIKLNCILERDNLIKPFWD